ncbi:MAG: hypothetical protein M1371_02590 [Actinobacteria bacterium]|nr:hypothetical protein [Actinomycetota bacterium]
MLDRKVVKEFLDEEFRGLGIKKPKDIHKKDLVETFCKFVEDDYYEWVKDNFQSFFNHGNPDWDWIKTRVKHYLEDF